MPAIYVLGMATVTELFGYYHFTMILTVVLLFVSSFISLTNAIYIKRQKQWVKQHQLVWKTDSNTNTDVSRKWLWTGTSGQTYPTVVSVYQVSANR